MSEELEPRRSQELSPYKSPKQRAIGGLALVGAGSVLEKVDTLVLGVIPDLIPSALEVAGLAVVAVTAVNLFRRIRPSAPDSRA